MVARSTCAVARWCVVGVSLVGVLRLVPCSEQLPGNWTDLEVVEERFGLSRSGHQIDENQLDVGTLDTDGPVHLGPLDRACCSIAGRM